MKRIPLPGFLRKIDQYLLEHHPVLWTVKLHFILPFAALLGVSLLGFMFFKPVYANDIPDAETWFTMLLVFSGLIFSGFGVWGLLYKDPILSGPLPLRIVYSRFLLTLMGGLALVALPWLGAYLLSTRVLEELPPTSLEEDVHALNQGTVFFEDALVLPSKQGENLFDYVVLDEVHELGIGRFSSMRLYGGSLPQGSDFEKGSEVSRELMEAQLEAFRRGFVKWGGRDFNTNGVIASFLAGNGSESAALPGAEHEINNNLVQWKLTGEWKKRATRHNSMILIFTIVFMGAVLFQVLQNVPLRQFLIAASTGILLIPITIFLSEFGAKAGLYNTGRDSVFSALVLLLILTAGALTFISYTSRRLKKLSGIPAILFNVSLPFLPLIFILTLATNGILWQRYLSERTSFQLIGGGMALYFLIGLPIMHHVFRRLRTSPKA